MQKLAENSQHILLCAGFLNFDPISPSVLEQVIRDFPDYEDVLPSITSDKAAFNKLKDELDGHKTPIGRLITNRGKTEDLAKWTCFNETITDAFSILHAITSNEGHEAEPEGVIALSGVSRNVLVSVSASMMCKRYNIEPIAIFEKHRGIVDALALRRSFAKFESHLNVKAIKMNNGTLLIHPSLKDYVDGYLQALRCLGVNEKFVSAWNIFANADFNALQNAYHDHAVNHLKDLETKLIANENARESTLKNDQQDLKNLLSIVDEYGISDTLIKEFARLDKMLDDSVAKLKLKQEQAKNKSKKSTKVVDDNPISISGIAPIPMQVFSWANPCEVFIKGNLPKVFNGVVFVEYQPATKQLQYKTSLGDFHFDLQGYTGLEVWVKDSQEIQSVDLNTGSVNIHQRIEIEIDSMADDDTELSDEQHESDVLDFYQNDDEEFSVPSTFSEENQDHVEENEEPIEDDFFGASNNTPVIDNSREIKIVNNTLKDVQKWVLDRAKDGREAKYEDAIAIYGRGLVDQAITENYVFNYKGFLEEA